LPSFAFICRHYFCGFAPVCLKGFLFQNHR
jgi:hypothetical protein